MLGFLTQLLLTDSTAKRHSCHKQAKFCTEWVLQLPCSLLNECLSDNFSPPVLLTLVVVTSWFFILLLAGRNKGEKTPLTSVAKNATRKFKTEAWDGSDLGGVAEKNMTKAIFKYKGANISYDLLGFLVKWLAFCGGILL